MFPRAFWAVTLVVCLVALIVPLAAQAQGNYLDVYVVHVKPEKVADFEALAKKMADANRHNNGDPWLALETVYGESNTYTFISGRQDYAEIDKGNDAFMGALHKAFGKDTAQKMLHDWNTCLSGSRTELRRRRWDLSRKAPDGAAAFTKLIGESRVLRTTAVHVRPGRVAEFEDFLKEAKAAGEQNPNTQPVLISQVIEGGKGTIFYVTTLRTGLAGFDNNPTMREILGDDGYKKFLQVSADTVESTQSAIYRYAAELSNPTQEVIAAAPDFWNPKPTVATHKEKPKTTGVEPAAQKTKEQQ
jgi:quinol monooxygenase YgiN